MNLDFVKGCMMAVCGSDEDVGNVVIFSFPFKGMCIEQWVLWYGVL